VHPTKNFAGHTSAPETFSNHLNTRQMPLLQQQNGAETVARGTTTIRPIQGEPIKIIPSPQKNCISAMSVAKNEQFIYDYSHNIFCQQISVGT